MDEKIKLILARQQINNLVELLKGNEYEKFLYSKLIGIDVELTRQLSHYNEYNFQALQLQVDELQRQLNDLNDLKQLFRLPKLETQNREPFEVIDAPDA
jgi:hypothetical protein